MCDRRGLFRVIARLQRVVLAVQNLLCLAVIKYISVSLLFVLSYILLIFSCLRIFEGGGYFCDEKSSSIFGGVADFMYFCA